MIRLSKDLTSPRLLNAKRIGVLGAGISGQGAARLLLALDKSVLILDDRDRSDQPGVRSLGDRGVDFRWGRAQGDEPADSLQGLDALVVSPGIAPDHPIRMEAGRLGLFAISEIELAWLCSGDARTVAISGTNGKTTVTLLMHHIAEAAGLRSIKAGNIGFAFSDAVLEASSASQLDRGAIFSVEVSSFQLECTHRFAPDIAILLNVTPDHLDRHGRMEAYADVKQRVTANQTEEQILIVNQDDSQCLRIAQSSRARISLFSLERAVESGAWLDNDLLIVQRPGRKPKRLIDLTRLPLLGMHNVANCLAAACGAVALDVDLETITSALETFGGAPHRLERVRTVQGVDYVDDSKATNVDSLLKAVASFGLPVHLIAGGRDKDCPFASILPSLKGHVAHAYLIGEAADKIAGAWSGEIDVTRSETLERALEDASRRAVEGETVLLSPGCASFDQFSSFTERGEVFRAWVEERRKSLGEEPKE